MVWRSINLCQPRNNADIPYWDTSWAEEAQERRGGAGAEGRGFRVSNKGLCSGWSLRSSTPVRMQWEWDYTQHPPHDPHPPPLCAILYITLMEILLRVLSNKVQTLHAIKRSPPRHQSRSRLNWNDLFLGHKHEDASTVSPLLSVIIPAPPPPPHPPPPPPSSDHVSKAIKPLAAVSASTFDSCSTSHVYSQLQLQTHTHTVGEHRVYTETWDGGR